MKSIETTVFTENKRFYGEIPGYEMGLCVEVRKKDGTLGYSSNVYLPRVPKCIYRAENYEEYIDIRDDISCMADLCDHDGNEITGRLLFNGYYESYYDWEEREECVRDVQKEVEETMGKYLIED